MRSRLVTLAASMMLLELKGLSLDAASLSAAIWQAVTQSAFSTVTSLRQSSSLHCIPAYDCQLLIKSNCCPGATRGVQHHYQAEPEHMLDSWSAIYAPESCWLKYATIQVCDGSETHGLNDIICMMRMGCKDVDPQHAGKIQIAGALQAAEDRVQEHYSCIFCSMRVLAVT